MDYTELPAEMLEEIASYVHDKFHEFVKSQKRMEVKQRVQSARDAYEQKVPPATFPWKGASNKIFPFNTITVDHMVPRLYSTIAGKDPMLTVDDFGMLDEQDRIDIQKFDNSVLRNDVRITDILDPWLRTLAIDGQQYVQIYWDREKIKRRKYAEDEQGNLLTEEMYSMQAEQNPELIPYLGMMLHEYTEVIHDGVKIDFVDMDDIYFPDRVDDWEEAPVIRKYWETWEAYKYKAMTKQIRGWIPPDKEMLEDMEGALYAKRPRDDKELSLEIQDTEDKSAKTEEGKLKQELLFLEGHINWDVDGDGIQEKLIVRIEFNKKKVVYIRNNNELDPFNRKQIQPTTLFPESHTAYGYGFFHKLEQIMDGASNLFNTLINSATIAMLPWFIYEEGAGFEEQQPELYPGRGVKAKDADKVKFPNINANAALFKDFLNFYIGLWERSVALSDYSLGRESETIGKKGSTATGTLAVIQEGQIAHEYLGTIVQKQFERVFEIIHDLYYLNMPPGLDMSYVGRPMRKLLSRNYKLKLMGATTTANRYAERMEVEQALMVGEKATQMGLVNPLPLLRMFFETIRNLDPEKVLAGPAAAVIQRTTQPQEGDPYPQIASDLAQRSPEELMQMMATLAAGEQVRGELNEKLAEAMSPRSAINEMTGM